MPCAMAQVPDSSKSSYMILKVMGIELVRHREAKIQLLERARDIRGGHKFTTCIVGVIEFGEVVTCARARHILYLQPFARSRGEEGGGGHGATRCFFSEDLGTRGVP